MSALGQGLVLTLHLRSVLQYSEPPATWVVQVNTAVGMSLVVEGDSAVDECREICMISTFCHKLSVSCIVLLLHPTS